MKKATEIEQEAADWVVRRDAVGDALSAQPDFQHWIASDVRHRVAYLRLNAVWERTKLAERLRPLDAKVDPELLAPRSPPLRPQTKRWLAMAAGLAAIGMGIGIWWAITQAGWQTYSTDVGAFERIRLEDGSTIQLNTNSRVRVRFSDLRRELVLKRGEAHFAVARDIRRPFDVQVDGNSVRAVGTAFAIRRRNAYALDVLVTEGRVALNLADAAASHRAAAPLLAAGEMAVVRSAKLQVTTAPAAVVAQRMAWAQGKLIFNQETLAAAVAEFNRYNSQQLIVRESSLAALNVTGTFEATDPASFIAALQRVFEIQVEASDAQKIVLTEKQHSN